MPPPPPLSPRAGLSRGRWLAALAAAFYSAPLGAIHRRPLEQDLHQDQDTPAAMEQEPHGCREGQVCVRTGSGGGVRAACRVLQRSTRRGGRAGCGSAGLPTRLQPLIILCLCPAFIWHSPSDDICHRLNLRKSPRLKCSGGILRCAPRSLVYSRIPVQLGARARRSRLQQHSATLDRAGQEVKQYNSADIETDASILASTAAVTCCGAAAAPSRNHRVSAANLTGLALCRGIGTWAACLTKINGVIQM